MKPLWRHILAAVLLLALAAVWILSDHAWARQHRRKTCQGVQTTILDSVSRRFVSVEDVSDWMKEYGTYVGAPLDSIDLQKVETLLDGKSAVRKSQAWLGDDGYLHVELTQREPVIRFQKGQEGFYADAEGFLFPLQSRFTARVPIVDGAIPVTSAKGYKGEAATPQEQEWIRLMLGLVDYLKTHPVWMETIGQMTVSRSGDLVLVPREGKERFILGTPTGLDDKFGRIRKYYEYIAPNQEEGYATVDVRFGGQIICRKK